MQSLLTVKQVAELLQCCEKTAWSLTRSGELPVVRLGRLVRVRPEDLADYLEAKAKEAGEDAECE